MAITTTTEDETAIGLYEDMNKFHMDIDLQRNEVWDPERESLFIDSLARKYYLFLTIHTFENVNKKDVIDGKQRLTTLKKWFSNELRLSGNLKPVIVSSINEDGEEVFEEVQLAGQTYMGMLDLHPKIARNIETAPFKILSISGDDEEELAEVFRRLNMGVPLSAHELRRVKAGLEVTRLFVSLSNHKLLRQYAHMTKHQSKHKAEEEVIANIMMILLSDKNFDFNGFTRAEVDKFFDYLREFGVKDELRDKVEKVLDYLSDVAANMTEEARKSIFTRFEIPVIAKVVDDVAFKEDIWQDDFQNWIIDFFKNPTPDFVAGTGVGKINENKVSLRYNALRKSLEDYKKKLQFQKMTKQA